MSIRTRLLAGLLVVGLAFGVVAALASADLGAARDRTVAMRDGALEPLVHFMLLKQGSNDAVNHSLMFQFEPDHADGALDDMLAENEVQREALVALEDYELPEDVQANLDEIRWLSSRLQKFANENLGADIEVLEPQAPSMTLAEGGDILSARSALAKESIELMTEVVDRDVATIARTYSSARRNLIVGLVGVIGVALAAAFLIAERIVRPVRRTAEVLASVADGDLTPRLETGRDEIGAMGRALNRTLEQVGAVIESIDASARELAARSGWFEERSSRLTDNAAAVGADADAASSGADDVSRATTGAAALAGDLRRSADDLAASAADASAAVEAAERAVQEAFSALHPAGGAPVAGPVPVSMAAEVVRDLKPYLHSLEGLHDLIVESANRQGGTTQELCHAVDRVRNAGDAIKANIDSVAAAVALTTQFLEDNQADAEQLSALSETLETMTAIFQVGDGADAAEPALA